MAQYAIFLYAPPAGVEEEPAPEALEAHQRYADDLRSSGAMVAVFPLQHVTTATSIRPNALTDGPFLEAKEVVIGFYVIEAPDLDSALKTARLNPILAQGGGLEVRPVAQ